jgi:hypothetical protein
MNLKEPTKRIQLTLTEESIKALDEAALELAVTKSNLVEILIRNFLKEVKRETEIRR